MIAQDWHETAQMMHRQGATNREIARTVKRSDSAVCVFIRKLMGAPPKPPRAPLEPVLTSRSDDRMVEPHKYRVPPPRPDVMNICRRYIAGEIDRATMGRLLRGEL